VLTRWDQLAVVITAKLNADVKRQLYLSLPHSFLPIHYRHDPNFIRDWLQDKVQLNREQRELGFEVTVYSDGTNSGYSVIIKLNSQDYTTLVGYTKYQQDLVQISTLVTTKIRDIDELRSALDSYQASCQLQQLSERDCEERSFRGLAPAKDRKITRHCISLEAMYDQHSNQIVTECHLDDYLELYEDSSCEEEIRNQKYLGVRRVWSGGVLIEEVSHSNNYSHDDRHSYDGSCRYWYETAGGDEVSDKVLRVIEGMVPSTSQGLSSDVISVTRSGSARQLKMSVNYVDDKRHGECQQFFKNGKPKMLAHYYKGSFVGEYRWWLEGVEAPVVSGHYLSSDINTSYKIGYWTEYEESSNRIFRGHYERQGHRSVKVGHWEECELSHLKFVSNYDDEQTY